MGKQGPDWEAVVRDRIRILGLAADRHPKRGQKGEPDVWAVRQHDTDPVPVLAWKRLVKLREGQQRRRPDGEPAVAVIPFDDFIDIVDMLGDRVHWQIQCKAAQQINVTRTLGDLTSWLKKNSMR